MLFVLRFLCVVLGVAAAAAGTDLASPIIVIHAIINFELCQNNKDLVMHSFLPACIFKQENVIKNLHEMSFLTM